MAKKAKNAPAIEELLRVGDGFRLADVDCESTPGFDGGKSKGQRALADHAAELGDWQEKLHAESKGGGKRSVLLVVQGMDTSGKGGIMRHVVSQIDPEGIRATAFKAPTAEERKHDFLWRIRNALPGPGQLGVFDRSHYEDVLIVRVHDLVPKSEWLKRYAQINAFEREVIASGTRIVKVMTHISDDEQKARLRKRLERPDKHYKYNPGDLAVRAKWPDYQAAYADALERCNTDAAPWYVIPAGRKWYRNWAVAALLNEHLGALGLSWPVADFDVAEEKQRLAAL